MIVLQCPVCHNTLYSDGVSLQCRNHHTFDISRYHYVNLAMDNRSSKKHHGDDRAMVLARSSFLNEGYYEPFRKLVVDTARGYLHPEDNLIDIGCGEGYYTDLLQRETDTSVLGIDISKEALREAYKRNHDLLLAVAGASAVPVPDASAHMIVNLFAPCFPEEFHRVLLPGGILLRGVPLEDHLWELKCAVYDEPYRNPKPETHLEHFAYLYQKEIRYEIRLEDPQDIQNLFKMTPYYYKTGSKDQEKLNRLSSLQTQLGFAVQVYRKVD